MGDLSEPGSVDAVSESSASTPVSQFNPSLSSIGLEKWIIAERAANEVMALIKPTYSSEESRKNIIDYIQKLIVETHGCKVFPFGSVPLKTYLPDGDIDLSAFCGTSTADILVPNVVAILEREAQNAAAEFRVNDVMLIPAEVKLVKCLVHNIVVDISFNQLGGLYTLCFLEQIDRFIGKDHLFKRSIILIKAWCFHESRILGAHHGLISTYALETLVLYIFHHFHSTLHGPLSVLYKFLDYFSKFDWAHYCISLYGPARLSSLPQIIAEKPENSGDELLLSDDIIRRIFGTPVIPLGSQNARIFPRRHMNIVDALKENNNLGRSISQGNFFRVLSAFTHGAKQLGRLLSGSEASIAEEMTNFFSTTLGRHRTGVRPDVKDSASMSGGEAGRNLLGASDLSGDSETQFKNLDFARRCCESAKTGPAMFVPPSQLHGRGGPRDAAAHNIHFRHDFYEMNQNMGIPRNTFYRPNHLLVPGAPFGMEDLPKSRGTGTYFPNVNRAPYISGNGRYQGNGRFPRNVNEANFHERGNFAGQSSSRYVPNIPDATIYTGISGLYPAQVSDFRPVGFLPQAVNLPEQMWQTRLHTVHAAVSQSSQRGQDLPQLRPVVARPDRLTEASGSGSGSASGSGSGSGSGSASGSGSEAELVSALTLGVYRLKNEDDFPPLSM